VPLSYNVRSYSFVMNLLAKKNKGALSLLNLMIIILVIAVVGWFAIVVYQNSRPLLPECFGPAKKTPKPEADLD